MEGNAVNDDPIILVHAYLDGELTDAERAALGDWLRADEANVDRFVAECRIHSELCDKLCGAGRGTGGEGFGDLEVWRFGDLEIGAAVEPPHHLEGDTPPSSFILHPSSLSSLPSPLSPPFVGGPVFSYLVAAVLLGVMLLGAWAYKISHHQELAQSSPEQRSAPRAPEMHFVGRITRTVDCRWSDSRTAAFPGASVPLGRKYALASGLLEISYDSGAKVILQGPCTYEVENANGGFLGLGKLTARIGKSAKPQAANPEPRPPNPESRKSPSSFIPHPSSLFSVRTPTAIVTDLGTEFGVEVDSAGGCLTHVFQGKVILRSAGTKGSGPPLELGAAESARMDAGSEKFVVVPRGAAAPDTFVRRIAHRGPIRVFSTGRGLIHGEDDPHWYIIAGVNDPNFKPHAAVVTAVASKFFRRNIPRQSQWISTDDWLPLLPEGTVYTFRTTFEINGEPPPGLELRGAFAADNHVAAIRLNVRPATVPEHGDRPPFKDLHPFSIADGFVEGTNVLEFDVRNQQSGMTLRPSRMVLLVELEAVVNPRRDTNKNTLKPKQTEHKQPADGGKENAR